MKRFILLLLLTTSLVLGQSIPPTNIFTQTGANKLPPPAIPPLTQVFVPQSNGDHSTDPDMFRRQHQSIVKDVRDNGGTLAQLEARLSTLMGSTAIKPQAGTPGAQFYAFAFQIVPPVMGQLSDGRNVTWNWIRYSYSSRDGLTGSRLYMRGNGTSTPPATMFTPPVGATPPRPVTPTTPTQPIAPKPPVKVTVTTQLTFNSTTGKLRGVVWRMVSNWSGRTFAPAPKSSRVSKPSGASQLTARPAIRYTPSYYQRIRLRMY